MQSHFTCAAMLRQEENTRFYKSEKGSQKRALASRNSGSKCPFGFSHIFYKQQFQIKPQFLLQIDFYIIVIRIVPNVSSTIPAVDFRVSFS